MTRRRAIRALAGLAFAGVLTPFVPACAESGPTEPVWNKQSCAHCGMVLSDRRYGAQLLTAGGDRLYFDDPGCLVLYLQDHEHGAAPARAWVRDALTGAWEDARSAHYAAGAHSPMDYGFEARPGGDVGWEAMRARVTARGGELR
jgi:copper chaperone NosL